MPSDALTSPNIPPLRSQRSQVEMEASTCPRYRVVVYPANPGVWSRELSSRLRLETPLKDVNIPQQGSLNIEMCLVEQPIMCQLGLCRYNAKLVRVNC